jgi:hypothetical protein
VLEEFTGVTCGNCPLGILAIDNLEKTVGSQFIPISLHGYSGDPWASAVSNYSSYLGFSAAPSGMIQRSGVISSPMYTSTTESIFELSSPEGDTWYDLVMAELEEVALADINAECIADTTKGTYAIPVHVKYPINATNLNLNLFAVVMEDGLTYFQENYLASYTNPNLGEFGKGGKYGTSYAVLTHNDVVRQVVGLSFAGTGNYLPQEMTAGQEYSATLSTSIPGTVTKIQNSKVAVLLIDANTGALINACVAPATYGSSDATNGIDQVWTADAAVEVYSLSGQRVLTAPSFTAAQRSLQSGLYLVRTVGADGSTTKKVLIP